MDIQPIYDLFQITNTTAVRKLSKVGMRMPIAKTTFSQSLLKVQLYGQEWLAFHGTFSHIFVAIQTQFSITITVDYKYLPQICVWVGLACVSYDNHLLYSDSV